MSCISVLPGETEVAVIVKAPLHCSAVIVALETTVVDSGVVQWFLIKSYNNFTHYISLFFYQEPDITRQFSWFQGPHYKKVPL